MTVREITGYPVCEGNRTTDMEVIYEDVFPVAAAWVRNMGGTFEDARDIFHDALVIYMEKRSPVELSEKGYLVGIVKHLWIRKFRRDSRYVELDAMEARIVLPEDHVPSVDDNKLLTLLERTGKRCLDLLRAFYFTGQPMKEISRRQGYSNDHSATVQKYKCLEKMRETVKQNTMLYEDFLE